MLVWNIDNEFDDVLFFVFFDVDSYNNIMV